jgi:hypothetical protein
MNVICKSEIAGILIFFSFFTNHQVLIAQEKTIKYFQDCILQGQKPPQAIFTDYKSGQRTLVWNEQLIKKHKYSDEEFDKLGYDYINISAQDNKHYSKLYRHCKKGILVEVTEWYGMKMSISMSWYSNNYRSQIYYLRFCLGATELDNSQQTPNIKKQKMYLSKNVECTVQNGEFFDTTFILNSTNVRLKCMTNCLKNFSVYDTLYNEIDVYQDRYFKFSLKGQKTDTQFVVTKQLIKKSYEDNLKYKNSVLAFPHIEKIDPVNNLILINAAFLYPRGMGGTDFFDEILFEISMAGRVKLKKIIPYKPPEMP